jgi:alkanesulfonate monooxygenase SsuD/methylene tetrahydromethanopterin reductase-like flavin-dependent oxidoreductase (luciferase family)
MEFGLGLLGYYGAAGDVAFAEQHGISTVGFVDSPLLGGDPFVGLALAAAATSSIRLGTFLAVPGNRSAATTATAIATINRIAGGRAFLGIGTGYTSRNAFGLRPVPAAEFAEFARTCRALLAGEVAHVSRKGEQVEYRLGHEPDRYIATDPAIPIYLAGDGAKALDSVGRHGDGWVSTMQFSHMMQNSDQVFADSLRLVETAAADSGASGSQYNILSTALGILRDGETPTSPRVLELVGPMAMLPFHSYADNPAIAEYLPPPIQDRLDVYEREVLSKFRGTPEQRHQWTHRGHLSFLQPGEEKVLTDEVVRMTTMTGSLDEVVEVLTRLELAGLSNVSTWVPPQLVRDTVLDIERRLIPALNAARPTADQPPASPPTAR